MKKNIIITLSFLILVGLLILYINYSNKKIDNFFILQKQISKIIANNKDLDIFIANQFNVDNFDDIQRDMNHIYKSMDIIKHNSLFMSLSNISIKQEFADIEKNMDIKINLSNKTISNIAVLNNSWTYVQTLSKKLNDAKLNQIYIKILKLEHEKEDQTQRILNLINGFHIINQEQALFLSHSKIILNYHQRFKDIQQKSKALNLTKMLVDFEEHFSSLSTTVMKDLKGLLLVLMMFLFIALLVFFSYMHIITQKKIELNRFKKAVENSDNIVVITNKDFQITYVNESFEKVSGYTFEEMYGSKPSVLNANIHPKIFYDNLKATIQSGKTWRGEFINKNKTGEISYEKATITPIFNENGDIEEYLAIKLDITQEKKTLELLKQKEHLLSQQSKMNAMREMLENIAHQWRQPLSTISTAASGIKINYEYENLDKQSFDEFIKAIIENTQYLSRTIDNFKNYFNTKNEVTLFDISKTIQKVLEFTYYKVNHSNIKIYSNIQKVNVEGLENELIQVLVNIINNSQEAFLKIDEKHKMIFFDIYSQNEILYIQVKDNAGGIPKEIQEHIFEPYYTTKHQISGTGMGLYMAYEIITKHFKGNITIQNKDLIYKSRNYKGAEVYITIPLKRNSL